MKITDLLLRGAVARRCGWPAAVALATAVAAWAALPSSAAAQLARKPAPTRAELQAVGLQERNLRVGGVERWFLVQPPLDTSRPAAVLLVLHGGTQSMRRLFALDAGASRGWPELARRENLLLLVPNGTHAGSGNAASDDQNWNDLREDVARESKADDVAFIAALLDWAHAQHHIDRSRVYVTGASNGGMMSFRLLIEVPERFAAAAAFVAALPADSSRIRRPALPTPLLLANGTRDPLVIYEGGSIAGKRGKTQPVPATVAWWIDANRAAREAPGATTLPDTDPGDRCTIEQRDHPALAGGAPVRVVTMQGGGHSMPSARYALPDSLFMRRYIGPVCRDVEAVELAWEFLSAHRR